MARRILVAAVLLLVGAAAGWLLVQARSPSQTVGDFKREAAGSA